MLIMAILILLLCIGSGLVHFILMGSMDKFADSIEKSLPELSKKNVLDKAIMDYVTVPINWESFINPNDIVSCEIRACSIGSNSSVPIGLLISGLYKVEFIHPCDGKERPVFATSHKDGVHLSLKGPFSNFGKLDIKTTFNCSERVYSEFVIPIDIGSLLDSKILSFSSTLSKHYLLPIKQSDLIADSFSFTVFLICIGMLIVLFDIYKIFSKMSTRHYE